MVADNDLEVECDVIVDCEGSALLDNGVRFVAGDCSCCSIEDNDGCWLELVVCSLDWYS